MEKVPPEKETMIGKGEKPEIETDKKIKIFLAKSPCKIITYRGFILPAKK